MSHSHNYQYISFFSYCALILLTYSSNISYSIWLIYHSCNFWHFIWQMPTFAFIIVKTLASRSIDTMLYLSLSESLKKK